MAAFCSVFNRGLRWWKVKALQLAHTQSGKKKMSIICHLGTSMQAKECFYVTGRSAQVLGSNQQPQYRLGRYFLWGKRNINIVPDHICVLLGSPPALRVLPGPSCHLRGLSQHPSPPLPMCNIKLSQHLAEMCTAPIGLPKWAPAAQLTQHTPQYSLHQLTCTQPAGQHHSSAALNGI